MTDQFMQRADNIVRIQSGDLVYADTPENFAADNGAAAPALPSGVTERVYEPGRRHALVANDSVIGGGDMPWAFGDGAIEAVTALLSAQAARAETPSPVDEAPNVYSVQTERARRLALGFNYDFGDSRGVHRIGTSDADMVGWDDVTKLAAAMLAAGQAAPINIVTNTGPATVTPQEWQLILLAAGAYRQPIWAASFALQAMVPIPADYPADSRWPAAT